MSFYNFPVFKIMTFGYYYSFLLLLINGFYNKKSGKFHPHLHPHPPPLLQYNKTAINFATYE